MVDDTIIRAAYILSKDPAFEAVIRALREDTVREFMSTSPDDKETRELAYHRSYSLTGIEQQIKIWAAMFQT